MSDDELVFVDADDLAAARSAVAAGEAAKDLAHYERAIDLLGGFRGDAPRARSLSAAALTCLAAAASRRATLALELSRPKTAAAAARRALAIDGGDASAWLALSRASRALGDFDGARVAAARGLEVGSADADADARRGLALAADAADADADAARYYGPRDARAVDVVGLEPLRILESTAASTGGCLWDGGLLLAHWLVRARPDLVSGKRVLVLGAGVGLEGLVCASRLGAAAVELTDCDATVLESLRKSVALNRLEKTSVSRLDFCDEAPPSGGAPRFDVVLGSEVVYYARAARGLLACVDARLRSGDDGGGRAIFVAARGRPGLDDFLDRARRAFLVDASPVPEDTVRAARAHEPRAARRATFDVILLRLRPPAGDPPPPGRF